MRDLGSLGGDCTIATGLNNNGTVVGDYSQDDQTEHAFPWKSGSIIALGGTLGGDNQGRRVLMNSEKLSALQHFVGRPGTMPWYGGG